MTRPASKHPTELELEILKILWEKEPCSVREVRDELARFRDLAYTSVMTVMGIMTDKGYLAREKQGKGYIYRPTISRKATSRGMLGDLIDRLFNGSTTAAMVNLLEIEDIDEKELEELRALIERKEGSE